MQDMITADAVKSFSRGHTQRLQLISAKTCCLAWHKSNLLAVLQAREYTESTKPGGKVASPRLMFPGHSMEPDWPAMTDGVLRHQRPVRQSLYTPQTVCGNTNEPPTKNDGEKGEAYVRRKMGRCSARQQAHYSYSEICHQSVWWGTLQQWGVMAWGFQFLPKLYQWCLIRFCLLFEWKATFYVSQMKNENVLKC